MRIGMVGAWHVHANDFANELRGFLDAELAAIWDDDNERGSTLAGIHGAEFVEDLDRLLARDDIPAVIIASATADHRRVLSKCLEAEKHVFLEKALASTSRDAREMIGLVRQSNRVVSVALSKLRLGAVALARTVLVEGRIGRLTLARIRIAHDGASAGWLPERFFNHEESGGGVLIDLAAHPLYLMRHLVGRPLDVRAVAASVMGLGVEDNTAVLMTFAGGAIGLAESSFVAMRRPLSIELHGTEGIFNFGLLDNRALLRTRQDPEWRELAIPEDGPTPLREWLDCIADRGSVEDYLHLAFELSLMVDLAYDSLRSQPRRSI